MTNWSDGIRSLIAMAGILLVAAEVGFADEAAALEHFERRIRPVLAERCLECHGSSRARNGLRLDSAAAMLQGGESGPAIVPGNAEASLLIRAISYHDSTLQMPPRNRMSEQVVADFVRWINSGAVDPREEAVATEEDPRWAGSSFDVAEAREHWSFSPPRAVEPPAVEHDDWGRDPIDAFILAKLEARDLVPAEEADRRTLIRRAYFDLIGLPPTPAQVAAFVADDSDGAFSRVVDELLASPQYGERWGRHWLDVVRYADSKDARGTGTRGDIANAWRYRDWVVNAFNEDYPYNQFIVDQVAGDLVEGEHDADRVIATAMLALGAWDEGDSDKRKMMSDIVDDQVDVVSRAVMGLTVSCARCHDHVFDPIGIEDYYAMAGFFFSSHVVPEPGNPAAGTPMVNIPLLSPEELQRREQAGEVLARLRAEIEAAENRHRREQVAKRLGEVLTHLAAVQDQGGTPNIEDALLERLVRFAKGDRRSQPHEDGLLTQRLEPDQEGLAGWGASATPWLMANQLEVPQSSATWTMPARSVAVHPAPDRAVAIGWRSDENTELIVQATIHDGDPNGGNGVAWSLELTRNGARQQVAAGISERGGEAEAKAAINVQPGDVVSLVIDPRDGDHSFDTTIVNMLLESPGNEEHWALAEVLDDVDVSNPHFADGESPRWYFYTIGGESIPAVVPAGSVLAAYIDAVHQDGAAENGADLRDQLRDLLNEPAPDETTPDAKLIATVTAPDGPVWLGLNVTQLLDDEAREELEHLRSERAQTQRLAERPVPVIEGTREGGVPGSEHAGFADARVHYRGRYDRLGDPVPRGFPRVLADDEDQPEIAEDTSGRLALAQWLVREDHPLTARVMVNRIWLHHFGQGLVRTPDDFGTHGAKPTHPQLLDNLARSFVESGWSIKAMHRRIMLSSTYRQSTRAESSTRAADPENELVGRMPRRRLEAEPLRDAMLAVTGELDLTRGGPAITDLLTPRRTLYLMSVRSDRSGYDLLFDAADPRAIISQRQESTVAPQAMFMMNHPFVLDRAAALAARVSEEVPDDLEARMERLYRLLYAREPMEAEVRIARDLIEQADGDQEAWQLYVHVLLCGNEFIYID